MTTQTIRPDQIEAQLLDAQTELARLTTEHSGASYDAVVTGDPDKAEQVARLDAQVTSLQARIGMLQAALTVARDKEAERLAALRIENQKATVQRAKAMLDRRRTYAEKLSEHLTQAARMYRLMVENGERCRILFPSLHDPKGAKLQAGDVRNLVANELWRVAPGSISNVGYLGTDSFPGASPAHPSLQHQPTMTPPLVERVKEANAHAIAELTKLIGAGYVGAPLDALEGTEPPRVADGTEPAGDDPMTALLVSDPDTGATVPPKSAKPTPARMTNFMRARH